MSQQSTDRERSEHERPIGVIFDMDGVLVDSATPHLQSWRLLGEELGASIPEEQFARTFGQQNRDIIPILFGPGSDERMQTLADRKEAIYRDLVRGKVPVFDGALDLIEGLHLIGVRLAVGSSGPGVNIKLLLDEMGVRDRFDAVVSAEDVSRGKPDPQVFSLAAERLGLPVSQCVVVEDAPVGVQAARAAGTRVVAVLTHHPAEAFDQPDFIAEHLTDLSVDLLVSLVANNA